MPPSHTCILFLEANPQDQPYLHTLSEVKNLKRLLEPLGFQIELAPALRIEELQTLLREHTPDILHFAGHGDQAGNLQAQAEDGNATAIPMDVLAEAVRIHNREQKRLLRRPPGRATGPPRRMCFRRARADPRRQRHRLCRGILWGVGRWFVGGRGL